MFLGHGLATPVRTGAGEQGTAPAREGHTQAGAGKKMLPERQRVSVRKPKHSGRYEVNTGRDAEFAGIFVQGRPGVFGRLGRRGRQEAGGAGKHAQLSHCFYPRSLGSKLESGKSGPLLCKS